MLYGRGPERARIDRLLDEVRLGRGAALVVRGEAGAGKSRLLDEAREAADDMEVLQATGIEAESELAYAGLHQLIRPLLGEVDELEPGQAAALRIAMGLEPGEVPDRFLVSVALLTLLSEAAESRPILLLVDDARWLDRPTADALVFVARRLAGEQIGLIAADRDDERSPFEVPGLPELRLGGLDPDAAAHLLDAAAPEPVPHGVAEELARRTHGNPLALSELPALLSPNQLAGRAPLPDPLPVGDELEAVFLDQVRQLPDATQRLLLVAAAADAPDLAPILAASERFDVGADALQPAEEARLVQADESTVRFRHPLIRGAVYHGATSVERTEAHRALAEVLSAPQDADRRIWHLAAATVGPDEDVALDLEASAERAERRGAFSASAVALQRAAQLSSEPETRGRRLAAAGWASYLGGQTALAEALLAEARDLLRDPIARANAALRLGEIHFGAARAEEGIAVLTSGADEVAEVDPATAVDLLTPAAALVGSCMCGDAQRVLRRADALPADAVGPQALAYIRSMLHLATAPMAEARPLEAVLPEHPGDLRVARNYWMAVTATHPTLQGRARGAGLEFLARTAATARSNGLVGPLARVLIALAWGEMQAGRFAAALADGSEALALARDLEQDLSRHVAAGILALVAAVHGRADDTRRLADEALHQPHGVARWGHSALSFWARGLLALGEEDPEAALFHLREIRPGGPLEQHWVTPLATPDLVEAAMWAGRPDDAREAADAYEAWAHRAGPPQAQPLVARCRAILAEDPEEAAQHYEEALRLHAEAERPFDQARTRLLYGELLRRSRRRVEAREQLGRALHALDLAGAEPWAQRARRELRATGQTLRRRDPQALDLLTPQELQIARYVGRGGTNKEVAAQLFLSPRTVASHLQSIFRKLGVATRTELAQYDLEGEGADVS